MSDVLLDLLRPGLKVVFCGTAAGKQSAASKSYYANPTNKFWRTLHEVGLTPVLLESREYPRLLEFGIGLTDLSKDQAGRDHEIAIQGDAASSVHRKIETNRPRVLAFNGKGAAREFFAIDEIEYGPQAAGLGSTEVWVLPSTSGAAGKSWDLSVWQRLATHLAPRVCS